MTAPRARILFLLAAVLLLVAGAAWSWSLDPNRVRVRVHLLALKLRGAAPYVPWRDVLWRLLPARFRLAGQALPAGSVRLRERGSPPCPALWDTPAGPFWGRLDDLDELQILLSEQLSRNIYESAEVSVRPGDVVFDVGSHLGTFTRLALQRRPRLVVAFEPDPVNVACFQRTFQNEIAEGRVIVVEAAAWETSGTLELRSPADSSASGSVVAAAPGYSSIRVAATTLDETFQRLALDRVDFIKMDIEGAERHAVRGGRDILNRFGPRMVLCIYHTLDDPAVVPETVLALRPAYRVRTRDVGQAYFH